MADLYCDHGMYPAPVAGGTTPAGAEDGNGKAKGMASKATMVITFTGIPAADEAITIAGVTFTAKASGATGNQFNAVTDAATCATNLRNAINNSTTNAVKPVGALGNVVPLKCMVNACVDGAVLTIHTRPSGSEWNSVVETSTLTNAEITSQWSGGEDGAWGYFTNTSALTVPVSLVNNAYGVFTNTRRCYLGSFSAENDTIVVRSKKSLNVTNNGTHSFHIVPSLWGASTANMLNIRIDDGTEWPADGASPVFTITYNMDYGTAHLIVSEFGGMIPLRLHAKKYSDSAYGFVLAAYHWTTGTARIHATGTLDFKGCHFKSNTSGVTFALFNDNNAVALTNCNLFTECKFTQINSSGFLAVSNVSGRDWYGMFQECVFSNEGNASSGNALGIGSGATGTSLHAWFDSCKFVNYQGSSSLLSGSPSRTGQTLYFRNCDFGNISSYGWQIAFGGTTDIKYVTASSSQFGYRDFFIDNIFGYVEWMYVKAYPTCNAKLLDGVTPWVIRVSPTTVSGRLSRTSFVETPRIGKLMTTPSGVKTLTIELAVEESYPANAANLSAVIDYIDTDGNRQVIDTYDRFGGALAASTAAWSVESGGKVTYVSGVTRYFTKLKFEVITPTAVKGVDSVADAGTEVGIVVRAHKAASVSTQFFFVDPEIVVT